jgi:branched-chain amino acid aminotransferase
MANFVYYVNGQFLPAEQASIGLNDLGFVRGYGIFDLLRTYGPVPFRLGDHLERLAHSAEQIELALPRPPAAIEQLVHATLARNGHPNDVTIRIVVTGGPSASFLMPEDNPTLLVMIAPINLPNPVLYQTGAALISVQVERWMPTVKSLNYATAVVCLRKARKAGAVEALYRSHDGTLSECMTSNFFAFKDGRLITAEQGVLDGVTRKVALEVAEDAFEIEYRNLDYGELSGVDEAFITSTTKEVMPIVRVDEVQIGGGQVGPCTQRMMELFKAAVRAETAAPAL